MPPGREKIEFFKVEISRWSRANLRDFPWRRVSDPYVVLVTEKLLQQTDFGHVRKVWHEFFRKFPAVSDLASASEEEVASVLKPLGLWRQRAKQLKALANELIAKYGGEVPRRYEDLRALPGVGDYVARATLVFAFGIPTYLLDVNTRKVVQRFFFHPWEASDREVIEVLELALSTDPEECKVFNWGLIDFSALVCSRKPKCAKCPLGGSCSYRLAQSRS